MNHARLILAGWLVLNLAGGTPVATAQKRINGNHRTILETVVAGDVDVPTLRAALEVLPRRPMRIDVVDDRNLSGPTLKQVAEMDAFIPIGTQTIYLRRQSRTLREAEYAGGPARLMLAVVIWHEMAHIDGLDEYRARRREEELWSEFIRSGRVDESMGLAYLRELRARK